jgi:hypothetical protein
MITSEQLAVFRKYDGDVDMWVRRGQPQGKIFGPGDWNTISYLLQELGIYKKKLVSEEYGKEISDRLARLAADDDVARQLMELA